MTPYYDHAGITIYHGDCREILPHLPRVDLVLTDPPYGVNLGNHHASKDRRHQHLHKESYASYDDTPENFRTIIAPVLTGLVRDVGQCIIFTAVQNICLLPPPSAIGGAYMPMGAGRNSFGFTNLAPALMYGKCPTNHLGCKNTMMVLNQQNEAPNGHPCPKPLKLIAQMVVLGSLEGQTILDPFMGSGTTLRAAKDLARKAIGIEIEESYCEIAANRLSQEVLNFDLRLVKEPDGTLIWEDS